MDYRYSCAVLGGFVLFQISDLEKEEEKRGKCRYLYSAQFVRESRSYLNRN